MDAETNLEDKNYKSTQHCINQKNSEQSSVSYPDTKRNLNNVFNRVEKPIWLLKPIRLDELLKEFEDEQKSNVIESDENEDCIQENNEDDDILNRTLIEYDSLSSHSSSNLANCRIEQSKRDLNVEVKKLKNDEMEFDASEIFGQSAQKKFTRYKEEFDNPFINQYIKKPPFHTLDAKYLTPKCSYNKSSVNKNSITREKKVLTKKDLNIDCDKKNKNIQFSLPVSQPLFNSRPHKTVETPLAKPLPRIVETPVRYSQLNYDVNDKDSKKPEEPAAKIYEMQPPKQIQSAQTKSEIYKHIDTPRVGSNKANKDFNTLRVKGKEYIVISKLGEGGSCQVYDCLDQDTLEHRAIKIVNMAVEPITANGYINEVKMLKSLQGNEYVVRMFDYEITNKTLFVILEKGGIDLSVFLRNIAVKSSRLPIHVINYYWMEMLNCVKEIHDAGIIHSDLKPSNFLIVDGRLKLIDFGIASRCSSDMTSVIKNVQVGTFNYISPEALLDSRNGGSPNDGRPRIKISFKSDVWSLGCILYQLIYRKTPFHGIGNAFAKVSMIMDPNHVIEYPKIEGIPEKSIEIIQNCLQYDMRKRPTVTDLISFYNNSLY